MNKDCEGDKPMIGFVEAFNGVAIKVYSNAVQKGFWDSERNFGEFIALCHSELSEALEAARLGNPTSDKIMGYSSVEEELADIIIWIMDWSIGKELLVAEALLAKIEYNKGRERLHGKKF